MQQVKDVAEDYYCQNQRQIKSYIDTLNEIKNLTQKYRNMVASELKGKQKRIVESFDQTLKAAENANLHLQTLKRVCKPVYSALAF